MKYNFIVYKTTNIITGMIYIGVHTRNVPSYLGSGVNIRKAIKAEGKENFKKEILYRFDNKEDMLLKERELVNEEFIIREDTYNIILGGGKLNTAGCVTVKDSDNNTKMVSINDEKYINGELKPVAFNKVNVKDYLGNTSCVNKDDPRYISGELVGIHKGMATVKDAQGRQFHVKCNDVRLLTGDLKGLSTGRVNVKDINNKMFRISKDDPRYNKSLFPICTGRKRIFNSSLGISKTVDLNIIDKYLDDGWVLGQGPNKTKAYIKKKWIHNLTLNRSTYIDINELEKYLNNNWKLGMMPKTK